MLIIITKHTVTTRRSTSSQCVTLTSAIFKRCLCIWKRVKWDIHYTEYFIISVLLVHFDSNTFVLSRKNSGLNEFWIFFIFILHCLGPNKLDIKSNHGSWFSCDPSSLRHYRLWPICSATLNPKPLNSSLPLFTILKIIFKQFK